MKTIVEHLFTIPTSWQNQNLYIAQDSRMTYEQTRQTMLLVAGWLKGRHGVSPGQQVALCLPMGMTAAQLVLGVLTAGASILPLQFNGPPARLVEILATSECLCLVTTANMAEKLGIVESTNGPIKVIAVEPGFASLTKLLEGIASFAAPVVMDPDELAAVFFTSGSTGQPKGVMMSRRSMTETSFIMADSIPLKTADRIVMLAPLHYASTLGLFYPIPVGCGTYIASEEETMVAQKVADILEREQTTVWIAAASRLRHLVESGELDRRNLDKVRYIEFFGEPIPIDTLRTAAKYFPRAMLQNTYGSSEAFWMSVFTVSSNKLRNLQILPIGKPLPRYEFGLYDDSGMPVPQGEIGEICVVGPVAITGYWKRPDLTAAARLNSIPNSYRTGDRARLGVDGNYYFAGRHDHQVKIRGHRFELGEIESVLRSHESVREAVAIVIGDEIAVCIIAENRERLVSEVRANCARRLPVFARPKRIIVLQEFPRLSSGKIDRIALQNLAATNHNL